MICGRWVHNLRWCVRHYKHNIFKKFLLVGFVVGICVDSLVEIVLCGVTFYMWVLIIFFFISWYILNESHT